ncbi:sugar ABC transporter permease [filamentous cyanobacterium LEGE 11480]|uniref:Sugar ABC transporter permease n=1 Tax=Romeriopsis navalis LEGE 11480 TaxID=2777977 RepID=A0A928VKE0_9CYAN|nr:sugar ABC transporter permease [Romeriopsis navalis]MBE9029262.1 sugar ABC transporter permease [Romeriopsis navalis LEGE 11480]
MSNSSSTDQRQSKLAPYWFLLPALTVLGAAVFYPVLQALFWSVMQFDPIADTTQWIGLKNFQKLAKDPVFWQALRNTLLYLLCVVPLLASLPLGLAILVNQRLRGIQWFRVAYYTPVVISMVVAGFAWKWLYAGEGLFNQILMAIGFKQLNWLTSPDIALFAVMAVTIWKGLGYYMVVYLAGLQAIPQDLYEAAAIDGSDGLRQHLDITVPLMQPYILLVAVISAISATKVFEEIFIMTRGGPLNASKTLVYYSYEQAFESISADGFSYGCTIGLVMFLLILLLSIIRLGVQQLTGEQNSGIQ